MVVSSCQLHKISFYKNAVVEGYVIKTTQDLLYEDKIVMPSPIQYYFIPKKNISFANGTLSFKPYPSFYELSVCDENIKEYLILDRDTIFYVESNEGVMQYSFITPSKLLIKKKILKSKNFDFYKLKNYRISLNNKDTLDILMNYHFKMVDVLD